jgi:hypothetical protein
LYCFYPDLGPVISLSKGALAARARHHTDAAHATFKGMQNILRINLTAARDYLSLNMNACLCPLNRQAPGFRNAVFAEINKDVRYHVL